ncbi:MAG: mechanosensitive ion channel [Pirellulales bacterium]|nr:mechanosensitive ion channel [Pirellulales bacterium]
MRIRYTDVLHCGHFHRVWMAVLLGAVAAWGEQVVLGQEPPPVAPPPGVTTTVAPPLIAAEDIRARLKELEKAEGLDDATRARAKELLDKALAELDNTARRLAEEAVFQRMLEGAAADRQQVEQELEGVSTEPTVAVLETVDLAQLRQELGKAEENLAKAKEALAALEAEPKRRANRKKEIPKLLADAREEAEQLARQLLAARPAQETIALAQAERAAAVARHQRLQQELTALEREVAAYDATGDLVRRRRDLAALRMIQAEKTANRWREVVQTRSLMEAKNEVEQARLVVEEAPPELRSLAKDIEAYAKRSAEIGRETREFSDQSKAVGNQLEALEKDFLRSREQVGAAGLTYAVGLLLRQHRAALPDDGEYDRRRRAREPKLRDAQLDLFTLDDERTAMTSLEEQVQEKLRSLGVKQGDPTRAAMEARVREILTKKRAQLDALLRNHSAYFDTLVQLDSREQRLVEETRKYRAFIDQRIFWIGSTDPLRPADARDAVRAAAWFVSLANWSEVGEALVVEAKRHTLLNLLALGVVGVLLYYQKPLRVKLGMLGEGAKKSTACEILPTVEALVATALIAVMWPAVLAYAGWRLAGSLAPSDFVRSLATGLQTAAMFYFPLELVRQVCRRNGLGEAHFGWPPRALEVVRHNLKWFVPVVLPLVLLGAACHTENLEKSLGRISTMAALMLVAMFTHRVLRPSGPFFRQMSAVGREGWSYRLRHVWYALGVFVPLALVLLAGWGYYYTCRQLAVRLAESACVPLGLAVVGAFLYRWVMVVRRRLAIDRMRQRIAAAAAAQESAKTDSGDTAAVPAAAPAPEPEVDLGTVADQTRRLIYSFLVVTGVVCLWCVWADALPALGMLEEVSLVPSDTIGAVVGAGGFTLADAGLLVLVVAMTLIANRNVPGFLEIAIPRQLPLDAGARYAISTISRYAITVAGLVWACSLVGIRWSTVQWLVAAVSVGLGFGLQEVFANFVCGLILLFERPIRVGDIVTVDDVSGVVSRIQIRATTVTNWDRKEFVVPNKEFITGRLLNWTLSDQINRVVVKVGVAYGSNTDLTRELLLQIAKDNPFVMADPAPNAMFEGFGDSVLNFMLMCFLPNFEHRLQVIHDLHATIHRVFAERGIEIAFPQQDIHIRSGPPTDPRGPR